MLRVKRIDGVVMVVANRNRQDLVPHFRGQYRAVPIHDQLAREPHIHQRDGRHFLSAWRQQQPRIEHVEGKGLASTGRRKANGGPIVLQAGAELHRIRPSLNG